MTEKEIREKAIETATKIWNDGNLSKQECIEMLGANLIKAHRQGREEYIKEILMRFHEAGLNGKNFDFFFVLKTDLDSLLSQPDGSGGDGKKAHCEHCLCKKNEPILC